MSHWAGDFCNVSALSRAAQRPDAARQNWWLGPAAIDCHPDPNLILPWTESLNQARHAIDERLRDAGWVVLRFPEHQDALAAAQVIATAVRSRKCCDRTFAGGRGWGVAMPAVSRGADVDGPRSRQRDSRTNPAPETQAVAPGGPVALRGPLPEDAVR